MVWRDFWVTALKKIRKQPGASAPKVGVSTFANSSESAEVQLRLLEKYPLFFRAALFPQTYQSNLGYWGLQCGPGWFPAVENAAIYIERELNKLLLRFSESSMLVTFERLLKKTCIGQRNDEEVVDESIESLIPYCSEICEAGGALRISLVNGYLCDGATWMAIRAAADRAILQASHLCERCGRAGQYRAGYWCRVYCEECAATSEIRNKPAVENPRCMLTAT